MASKISLILSLVFVISFFVLGSDIINVQYIYANLDALSINVNYLISREFGVTNRVLEYIERQNNITITYNNDHVAIGEPYDYQLISTYNPFVMNGSKPMEITISRSVIIGYFN